MTDDLVEQVTQHITGAAWHDPTDIADELGVPRGQVVHCLEQIPHVQRGMLSTPDRMLGVWRRWSRESPS